MAAVLRLKSSDLPPGQCRAYQVDGRTVVVYRFGNEFFATQGLCPHEELPLADGQLTDHVIECPWHGSRFNVRTGKVLSPPAEENLKTYEVRVDGDFVTVALP